MEYPTNLLSSVHILGDHIQYTALFMYLHDRLILN